MVTVTIFRLMGLAVLVSAATPAFPQTGKISGIVTNGRAAEAGVWVIAETEDLPTRFAKIVVTDERGRFLIPELPKASYRVWVRGYGLLDSKKIKSRIGDRLRLKAAIAPNEGSAAQYYPSIYWYSMLGIPDKAEFPLGNAASQADWLNVVKTNGCVGCHALGTAATRTVSKALGHFK